MDQLEAEKRRLQTRLDDIETNKAQTSSPAIDGINTSENSSISFTPSNSTNISQTDSSPFTSSNADSVNSFIR